MYECLHFPVQTPENGDMNMILCICRSELPILSHAGRRARPAYIGYDNCMHEAYERIHPSKRS